MIEMFPYPVPPRRNLKVDSLRVVRANTLQQVRRLVLMLIAMQFIQMIYLALVVFKR